MQIPSEAARSNRSHVRISLCGANRQVLIPVRAELMSLGYSQVDWLRTDEELRRWLLSGIADLLVVDKDLEGGSATRTVREMRSGDLGENPFAVVIMTTWHQDGESVREAINAGVDDLIAAPYSTGQLLDRIRKQIEDRKPFIVTSDYIGPERRRDPTRRSDIPSFTPPNTLRMHEQGEKVDSRDLREMIRQSATEMSEEKLRRIGFQVSFLVDLVGPELGSGNLGEEARGHMVRLAEMSREAVARLKGTKYEPISQLCVSLEKVARRIAEQPDSLRKEDVELLKPLSRAVLEAFFPSADTEDLIGQIAGAIDGYHARQNRVKSGG